MWFCCSRNPITTKWFVIYTTTPISKCVQSYDPNNIDQMINAIDNLQTENKREIERERDRGSTQGFV